LLDGCRSNHRHAGLLSRTHGDSDPSAELINGRSVVEPEHSPSIRLRVGLIDDLHTPSVTNCTALRKTEGASAKPGAWWCELPHATQLPGGSVPLRRDVAPLPKSSVIEETVYSSARLATDASISSNGGGPPAFSWPPAGTSPGHNRGLSHQHGTDEGHIVELAQWD